MAVLVLTTLAALPPAQASAATDPVARLDWSVPDRTVADSKGFIQRYYDCSQALPAGTLQTADSCSSATPISPTVWELKVNACASTADPSRSIVDYAFHIRETGATGAGGWCERTFTVPSQGTYTVDLTVKDSGGGVSTTSTAARVRDILFASLGDSYGSGEGNPPFMDGGCLHGVVISCGSSESTRCNRSTRASAAQAALKLEQDDAKSSVTFIHLACSGAKILDPNTSDGTADGGLLHPYEGVKPIERADGSKDIIPPQIDYLKALVGQRKIDFLHLSVGGNDMGFADIITACIDVSFLLDFPLWLVLPNCDVDVIGSGGVGAGFEPAVRIFNRGIAALPGRYKQLNDELAAKLSFNSAETDASGKPVPVLSPERVYITEYPDSTKAEDGDYCGWPRPLHTVDLPGFSYNEFKWASQKVAPSLNAVMKSAAGGFGWNYVGGISAAYHTHGYCADDNWVVNLSESFGIQGDKNGTFHPNLPGQTVGGDRMFARLRADVRNPPAPPSIKVYPTGLIFSVNSAGANGWETGKCPAWGGGACDRDAVLYTAVIKDNHAIQGPAEHNLGLAIDGQPVTLTRTSSGSITCTPANAADKCDLFPDSGKNPPGAVFVVSTTRPGAHTLDFTATNVRGLTATHRHDIKVDLTPPTLDPAQITSGTSGANSWYVSPVGLRFSASDAAGGSGLAKIETLRLGAGPNGEHLDLPTVGSPAAGPITATLSAEGQNRIAYEAVDHAGLRSSDTVTNRPVRPTLQVNIDTRAPSVTGAPDRGPDKRGWYNQDVTVAFSATDPVPGSGIDAASVTPDVVLGEGAGQSANGSASDVAGHSAATTVGPMSVDKTAPSAALTGGSDGSFAYSTADLLSGTVITNASSLTVGYSAGDALSGLHEVRLGGASSTAASGNLTVPVPAGVSTLELVVEDVAGNTTAVPFTVLRVDALAQPDPRGAGFWRAARTNGAYSEQDFGQLLAYANMASRSFGAPDHRYDEATLANADEFLQPKPASDVDARVRRHLLAAWLNVVTGREGTPQAVDLAAVNGWDTVVTNTGGSAATTALNVLREVELRLSAAPGKQQLQRISDLLEALNTGSLNT